MEPNIVKSFSKCRYLRKDQGIRLLPRKKTLSFAFVSRNNEFMNAMGQGGHICDPNDPLSDVPMNGFVAKTNLNSPVGKWLEVKIALWIPLNPYG